jgi:hypothetical protein
MEQEKIDIMQEVTKIVLENIRKHGGMVLVLALWCWYMFVAMQEQKKDLQAQMQADRDEYQKTVAHVSARLDNCETARVNLVVEVERLKAQMLVLARRR